MNDSSDWTFVFFCLVGGSVVACSMLALFWASMKNYYKEKFARKGGLSLPYNFGVGRMMLSGLLSLFFTSLGIWVTSLALVAIIDSDLSQDQVFAISNLITILVSLPVIALTWIGGYQGAKLFILEFKTK